MTKELENYLYSTTLLDNSNQTLFVATIEDIIRFFGYIPKHKPNNLANKNFPQPYYKSWDAFYSDLDKIYYSQLFPDKKVLSEVLITFYLELSHHLKHFATAKEISATKVMSYSYFIDHIPYKGLTDLRLAILGDPRIHKLIRCNHVKQMSLDTTRNKLKGDLVSAYNLMEDKSNSKELLLILLKYNYPPLAAFTKYFNIQDGKTLLDFAQRL